MVWSHQEFDDHEQIVYCRDPAAGLNAIIAIHNTHRGPGLGGCRMFPYASEEQALTDVLRLARGMTYKAAISNLALGGGKAVVVGSPHKDKSEALFTALGQFVDSLGGRYVTAEDSGTSVEDMKIISAVTGHVAGHGERASAERFRSSDPSPATAHGVFAGLRAAVRHRLDRDDLAGLRVAVQGAGSVGGRLARHLHDAGARLWIADVNEAAARRVAEETDAVVVQPAGILSLEVDVIAPCALGAVLNDASIAALRATVIAGAANNQLAEQHHGAELMKRNILYAPDYAINAGGIIDIDNERTGFDEERLLASLNGIYDTLMEIFERAEAEGLPTNVVADTIAEERFRKT